MVYLGHVSYGTYLWHWPVIIVATSTFEISPPACLFIASLLATGLASLSFQILERPIRESQWLERYRVPVIAVGLVTSIIGGTVIVSNISGTATGSESAAVAQGTAASGATPVPVNIDWRGAKDDTPEFPSCLGEAVEKCIVVRGGGPHVMLMGDSHMRMLVPPFAEIAKDHDLTLSTAIWPVCPWQIGVLYTTGRGCEAHRGLDRPSRSLARSRCRHRVTSKVAQPSR